MDNDKRFLSTASLRLQFQKKTKRKNITKIEIRFEGFAAMRLRTSDMTRSPIIIYKFFHV